MVFIEKMVKTIIQNSALQGGARVAEWLSASAFGLGGPEFEPRWSRPLSFHDVLGQDRFSKPLGSIPRFVRCMPPKSPLDLSCHKMDVQIQIENIQ